MTLATYRRTGGGAPPFDEELEIDADGTFRLLRRVSADRAGSFAGSLETARRDQLIVALDALRTPVVIRPDRPGAVLELVDWTGGSASFPLEAAVPSAWQRLRELLQSLVEDLKAQPVAALEVRLDDSADVAVLSVVGDQPVHIDFDGSVLVLSLFGEDEGYLDSAPVTLPADLAGHDPLPPGWRREIRLEHGLPFDPKRTLQLSVDLTIEGCESQLTCTAGKGWF